MESGFLAVILVLSFGVYSSHAGITEWDDVLVVREGSPVTLVCTDTTARGAVAINWMVKSVGANKWKLVLSADEMKEFSGGASKASMRLTDPNFQETGVFSLSFLPRRDDAGLYSCLIKQQERKLKERNILLAILTVTVLPSPDILQLSTLRLIANVHPDKAAAKITWVAPDGIAMRGEKVPIRGTEAKVPQVQSDDDGVYMCMVYPSGNSSTALFTFPVNVTAHADNVTSFANVRHDPAISTAAPAQTSLTLICPSVQGDYVQLYWQAPDSKTNNMKRVYEYDRWRDSALMTEKSNRLQLAGPPYNARAGSFAFRLVPDLEDGGHYVCNVFLNDKPYSQRTQLSVLKVETKSSPSKLELICQYCERSQVRGASWRHQDKTLAMESIRPGRISTTVRLPVTSDTAGSYRCVLELRNGQTIWATQDVTLPSKEHVSVATSSATPSLLALLLLVPLVAAAVAVLLWRQKQISERGIEQSLSVHSREVENIYENPEDIRQAPPEGSVYMDLKPRGEDDVYKELERCERCQS